MRWGRRRAWELIEYTPTQVKQSQTSSSLKYGASKRLAFDLLVTRSQKALYIVTSQCLAGKSMTLRFLESIKPAARELRDLRALRPFYCISLIDDAELEGLGDDHEL